MAEPSMMTLVALCAYLPVTSTLRLFFRVDVLVANRISPLLVNMEVGIGANSYFKTSLRFMSRPEAFKPMMREYWCHAPLLIQLVCVYL